MWWWLKADSLWGRLKQPWELTWLLNVSEAPERNVLSPHLWWEWVEDPSNLLTPAWRGRAQFICPSATLRLLVCLPYFVNRQAGSSPHPHLSNWQPAFKWSIWSPDIGRPKGFSSPSFILKFSGDCTHLNPNACSQSLILSPRTKMLRPGHAKWSGGWPRTRDTSSGEGGSQC